MKKFILSITSATLLFGTNFHFANAQNQDNFDNFSNSAYNNISNISNISDDDLFLKIRDAYRKKNKPLFNSFYSQLQLQNPNYPLMAYAQSYDLRFNFDNENSVAVKNFINQHPNELITELLIADWLVWLEKNNRWADILQNYRLIKSPSAESKCIFYKANLQNSANSANSANSVINEIKQNWISTEKGFIAPENNKICEEIFNKTYAINSAFSADEILSRAVLQIENNKISAAKKFLSAKSHLLNLSATLTAAQINEAVENPMKFLAKNSGNINSSQTALLATLAIIKFSQKDPQQAAEKFISLQENSNFTPSLKALAWSQIGANAAKQHLSAAQTWFDYAFANINKAQKDITLSDDVYEWAARAALRAKNFQNLAEIIQNKMPEHLKNQHVWIYWLARATNNKSLYKKISTRATQKYHFYNTLADEELGISPYLPADAKTTFSKAELAQIQANPNIQRALTLFRIDLRSLAVKEWAYANVNIFADSDDKLLNSAELAKNLQIWDREINTSEFTKTKHNFSQRYVAPYSNDIVPVAKEQGLDPAWVYGLMRQESRFVTHAKSNVGASGLMQLMPATAKWVANKIGLQGYHHGKVNNHDVNVLLGTSYMRIILEDLSGMPILATAAYNAGPRRAKRWRALNHLEGAIYAETIPFSETRDYVKKVLNNAVYYSMIFNQPKIMTLKQRLGVVDPKQ